MNSRQRRKLEAARHNALRIEEEAYREDMERDPEKYGRYRIPRTSGGRTSPKIVSALIVAATLGAGGQQL